MAMSIIAPRVLFEQKIGNLWYIVLTWFGAMQAAVMMYLPMNLSQAQVLVEVCRIKNSGGTDDKKDYGERRQ